MLEMSQYEQCESGLWELVGSDGVTLGLQDFIRILVNHRPIVPYKLDDIIRAFAAFGAEETVGVLDKTTLISALVNNSEAFTGGELMDALTILAGGSGSQGAMLGAGGLLPDQVSVIDFARNILGFEVEGRTLPGFEDDEENEEGEEMDKDYELEELE